MPAKHPRQNPGITVYGTTTLNGIVEEADSDAQVAVIAVDVTGDGDLKAVGPEAPMSISDASSPLEPLGPFGAEVPAEGGLVVDSNAARLKLDVLNPNNVRIWLGIGQPAEVGIGGFLDPGGNLTEYTTSAIYSIAADSSEHTVCGQEWGA